MVAPTPAFRGVFRVYFDLEEKMQPVRRVGPVNSTAVLRAALTELLKGPSAAELSAGLHTLVPAGTKLRGVKLTKGIATIDLDSRFASGGGMLSMTNRLAQVVFTATQFPTVKGVNLKLDGKAVTVFGGEGIILDHPQTRADYEGATPAIFVDEPVWLGTLLPDSVVSGTANVFEATFRLQLRDSAGALLVNTVVHATSGTGTRGSWKQKVTWTDAATGRGELKLFAASAKDGTPTDVITIPVTIRN